MSTPRKRLPYGASQHMTDAETAIRDARRLVEKGRALVRTARQYKQTNPRLHDEMELEAETLFADALTCLADAEVASRAARYGE